MAQAQDRQAFHAPRTALSKDFNSAPHREVLEQRLLRRWCRWLQPEVLVGPPGRGATARRALDQAALQQVGLVHVLDRVLLLPDRHRERRQTDRTATELVADRVQDLTIETVETLVVDLEHVQRRAGDLVGDDAAVADLGVIADAAQQPVGDPRRASAAAGDRDRAVGPSREPAKT